MTAKILKGKLIAEWVEALARYNIKHIDDEVTLAVVQVGNNQASNTYIKNKEKACERCGINAITEKFDDDITQEELIEYIRHLNGNNDVTGILVQLPLPNHIDEEAVLQEIWPKKDVDGFTYWNAGKLYTSKHNENRLLPCTAAGIIHLLEDYDIQIEGKNCVVVGRSNIVGKPTASLLLDKNGTVTVCHSKTKNLKDICKLADILVCAIGKPKFFTKEYVKEGAVVIDVGINRDEDGKLCGDVDFDDVIDVASAITPVPGGCGVLTVAELMLNCVKAYKLQNGGVGVYL